MRVVCVDADVLLHCESLQNLPWGQVLQDPNILVVIVPCVAREVDRLKVNGSARLQLKARNASQLLRKIFSAGERTISLRAADPKLKVELASSAEFHGAELSNHGNHGNHGNHQAEDRLIAEMLALGYNKSALVLLTNDTVAAMRARDLGVQAELIPEEWLLAPEASGAERAIERLRQELHLSTPAKPRLALSFEDKSGERINGPLQLVTTQVPALTDTEVAHCMAALMAAHPYSPRAKSLSQSQVMRSVYGEVGRTYDQLYNDYIADCKRVLGNLSELVGLIQCKGAFSLLLNNVGSVPVKDVAVDFSIAPGQWLLGASAFLNNVIELPACPAAGQDEIKYPSAGMDLARPLDKTGNDAVDVRWRKPHAVAGHREMAAQCDEFRPGDSKRFSFVVELAKLGAEEGEISVSVSAKDLDEAVTALLPVHVTTRTITRERAIADGLIRGELAQILAHTVALV